jgi:1-acyl-sn-glycerol-3-phosphate acyltransferase
MGKIVRFVYTLYCAVPFLISFIVVIPFYFLIFNFLPKSKAPHVAHALSRLWAGYLFIFFFIRIKVKNREYIDPKQTYVFVANHLSLLDIPLYARSCSNTFRFLAKAELAKIPLMGYVIKNLYITVKRGDKADRSRSLEKMKASLNDGISVFLAPEGTRNKSDKPLLDFKDGAFRLAIASQKPLAVLTVMNTNHLLSPSNMFVMRPGTVIGVWSKPVETKGMTDDDLESLKENVRTAMLGVLLGK